MPVKSSQKRKSRSSSSSPSGGNGGVKLVTPSGKTIPSKYLDRARGALEFRPLPLNKLRLFLHGGVGTGKSSFGLSIPHACVLDFEHKTASLPYRGEGTIPFYFPTLEGYNSLIDDLIEDAEKDRRSFDVVVFDVMDTWRDLQRDGLSEEAQGPDVKAKLGISKDITDYGKGGKGWDLVNRQVASDFTDLYQAGYGIVVLSHMFEKVLTDGEQSRVVWQSALNPGIVKFLHNKCEFAGCFSKHVEPERVGGRVVHTVQYQLEMTGFNIRFPARESVPLGDDPILIEEGKGWVALDERYEAGIKARRKEINE